MDSKMETNQIPFDTNPNMDCWSIPTQDNNQQRIDSFERVYEQVKLGETKLDSFGQAIAIVQAVSESSDRVDSETLKLLMPVFQEMNTDNQDVEMGSMESVPSSTFQHFWGSGKTSLPEIDGSTLEETFYHGERFHGPLTNQSILVSPPDSTTPMPPPVYISQETRPPVLDPTQEILGTSMPNNFYHEISGSGQSTSAMMMEPERFKQATSTSEVHGQNSCQDDEVVSVHSTDSEDTYKLSPENRLEITVSYSTLPVCGTVMVDRSTGCVMYYKKTTQELLDQCQHVSFPSLENKDIGKKFAKVSPKALELTERALNALQGGLQLFWKADEGVYAIRRSRGKIYWTSTQIETSEPQELSRNQQTMVFNWKQFKGELTHRYAMKAASQHVHVPYLPAIFFTFAQKWCKDSAPVTSCLVWAKVIPKKAEEMVIGLFPRAKSAPVTSLNSGYLQMSS